MRAARYSYSSTPLYTDPAMFALTGGDASMIPGLARAMVYPLALCPGVGHMYTAHDDATGDLVGYLQFALPGHLMGSTCVAIGLSALRRPISLTAIIMSRITLLSPEQQEAGRVKEFMDALSPEGREYYMTAVGVLASTIRARAYAKQCWRSAEPDWVRSSFRKHPASWMR